MDHIGEMMSAFVPPADVTSGYVQHTLAEIPLPDIDVPITPAAQRVIDRCAWYVETSYDDSLDLADHFARAFWDVPECSVAKMMNDDGVLSNQFISCLETLLGETWGTASYSSTQPILRLERIIIRAKREAYRRRHSEVSSMHLLWGLMRERSGPVIYQWEQAATTETDQLVDAVPGNLDRQKSRN